VALNTSIVSNHTSIFITSIVKREFFNMKANPLGALHLGSQIRNILLSAAFMTTAALAMAPLAHAQDEDELARDQREHEGYAAVHGGNKPLVGAAITLYAAGTTGYGGPATVIAKGTTNGKGQIVFYYFKKPSGNPQTYIVALGGNAGQGTNPAIGLSAALGPYDCIPSRYIVDEITTAASVYALSQFLSADGTQLGTSATNVTGLDIAAATTQNLMVLKTGRAATAVVERAYGTPPTATLNTLGDVLDAANSAAPWSAAITNLFADATPPGGTAPTTTLQAALDIARNPARNASAIFGLASGDTAYTPVLSVAPNDWTLGIDFTGGRVLGANTRVGSIGVDGAGKVWFAAFASDSSINGGNGFIANLSSVGVPSKLYTDNGQVASPFALAIDGSGNVFVPNETTGTVTGLANSGRSLTGSPFNDGGAVSPFLIAVDASGHVVVGNGTSLISELAPPSYTATALATPPGTLLPIYTALGINGSGTIFAADGDNQVLAQLPNTTYSDPTLTTPAGLAFDPAGNAWVGNSGAGISEFLVASGFTPVDYVNSVYAVGGIAIDSSGNVWVANQDPNGNNGVVELTNSGTQVGDYISVGGAFANANGADNVALDAAGNVWVAGDSNHVIEVIGAAAPVKTPVIEQPKKP
jgi:sugar lactone lactonase YvrE